MVSASNAGILDHPHNFINPPSNAWKGTVADSVGLAFVLIFVILRCYTKLFITKGRGWEDCKTISTQERRTCTKSPCADTIILALVCFIVFVSMNFVSDAKFGAGRHSWDIPPSMYNGALTVGNPETTEVRG